MHPPDLSLLRHPYHVLHRVVADSDVIREAGRLPGTALIWRVDPDRYRRLRRVVERRPGGLSLIVVLPKAPRLERDASLIQAVQSCRPHGLLPHHDRLSPRDAREVLRRPALDLAADVTDYLEWRGLVVDRETTHLLRRIIERSGELKSITALARSLYMSRRALGRRLMTRGLPVPSHWLQLGRLLRLSSLLQNSDDSIASIAYGAGYPDGFSLSNQMQRLIGFRPSQVRDFLGWEWVLEAWLRKEAEEGGLAPSASMEIQEGTRASAPPPANLPKPLRGRARRRRRVV